VYTHRRRASGVVGDAGDVLHQTQDGSAEVVALVDVEAVEGGEELVDGGA
jgi:hypothetical protein